MTVFTENKFLVWFVENNFQFVVTEISKNLDNVISTLRQGHKSCHVTKIEIIFKGK